MFLRLLPIPEDFDEVREPRVEAPKPNPRDLQILNNIFDRQPPLFASNFPFTACYRGCKGNTYPQLYDPLGRYIFVANAG